MIWTIILAAGESKRMARPFRSLPEGAQAAVVLLADQPSISHTVIDKVIDAYYLTSKGIILPSYKKKRGHPVIFDMKYKSEIAALSPEVGLRGIVYGHPNDVYEVPVNTSSILRDIDDMKDYKRELLKKN